MSGRSALKSGSLRSRALPVLLGLALAGGACSLQERPPAAQGAASTATGPGRTGTSRPTTSTTAETGGRTTQSTARQPARYVFPVQPLASCQVSYGHFHHDYPATDIFAKHGCRFVAPTDGTVTEAARVDRWDPSSNRGADRGGRSVAVVGTDGVRYYGSHLDRVAAGIAPGARVRAGQLLGLIGNSGDARSVPTHLHFGISWPTRPGIWWVRRGVVAPWPYLDSWRAGGGRSPDG
ncbi:MAG TPA: M23 family metallopeptidase, partial [Actinomycetota bacterium]|nr:M23 family metallopeptidase [Actinomycetota bacterium]